MTFSFHQTICRVTDVVFGRRVSYELSMEALSRVVLTRVSAAVGWRVSSPISMLIHGCRV